MANISGVSSGVGVASQQPMIQAGAGVQVRPAGAPMQVVSSSGGQLQIPALIPAASASTTQQVQITNAANLPAGTIQAPTAVLQGQQGHQIIIQGQPQQAVHSVPAAAVTVSTPQSVAMATAGPSSSRQPVASGATAGYSSAGGAEAKVLDKKRLQELVKEVDPLEQLDEDVEEMLLQIADDFIDNVVTSACQIAKHRKANTVEVKDVQLHLERNWNMWIPGFGSEELKPIKKAATTEAHKQRLALIRKTLKKY